REALLDPAAIASGSPEPGPRKRHRSIPAPRAGAGRVPLLSNHPDFVTFGPEAAEDSEPQSGSGRTNGFVSKSIAIRPSPTVRGSHERCNEGSLAFRFYKGMFPCFLGGFL